VKQKLIPEISDAQRTEQLGLVIFKEEDGDGRQIITADEERVLRWGWTEISLYR